ncbi:hypothetical protein NL676_023828 [Syzygium grande]|nr:hypothetical protein NL676_023828 [Syzygium grande]
MIEVVFSPTSARCLRPPPSPERFAERSPAYRSPTSCVASILDPDHRRRSCVPSSTAVTFYLHHASPDLRRHLTAAQEPGWVSRTSPFPVPRPPARSTSAVTSDLKCRETKHFASSYFHKGVVVSSVCEARSLNIYITPDLRLSPPFAQDQLGPELDHRRLDLRPSPRASHPPHGSRAPTSGLPPTSTVPRWFARNSRKKLAFSLRFFKNRSPLEAVKPRLPSDLCRGLRPPIPIIAVVVASRARPRHLLPPPASPTSAVTSGRPRPARSRTSPCRRLRRPPDPNLRPSPPILNARANRARPVPSSAIASASARIKSSYFPHALVVSYICERRSLNIYITPDLRVASFKDQLGHELDHRRLRPPPVARASHPPNGQELQPPAVASDLHRPRVVCEF